jgi:hypothetical protein
MKSKLMIIIVITAVLVLGGCSGPAASPSPSPSVPVYTDPLTLYTHSALKYKIAYPSGWNVSEKASNADGVYGVKFSGPEHNATIEVVAAGNSNVSLTTWANQYVASLNMRYYGMPVIMEPVNDSGSFSYIISYDTRQNGQRMKNADMIIGRGDKIFLIGYVEDTDYFDSALAQSVFHTFTFV